MRKYGCDVDPPRAEKIKNALLCWLIRLPLPIVIWLLFFRGCNS